MTSASKPDTHYLQWDYPGDKTAPALCGLRIRRTDHSNDPTCNVCKQQLARREAQEP